MNLEEIDLLEGPLPCTTAALAAIDAAGWERSARAACGLVTAVAQQKVATPASMIDVLERLGRVPHTRSCVALWSRRPAVRTRWQVRRRRPGTSGRLPSRAAGAVATPIGLRRLDLVVDLPDGRTLVIHVDGSTTTTRGCVLVTPGRCTDRDECVVLRIPAVTVHVGSETSWVSSPPSQSGLAVGIVTMRVAETRIDEVGISAPRCRATSRSGLDPTAMTLMWSSSVSTSSSTGMPAVVRAVNARD
jgi:hypothetical protein